MSTNSSSTRVRLSSLAAALAVAGATLPAAAEVIIGTDRNALFGVDDDVRAFLSANRGSNGGGDQSQQGGDALVGTDASDLMIGALGIDVMLGNGGDDVMIGGTEDFNPFNRDRAFGGAGGDVFLWAPGDGNDFFDGGDGEDVVMLGLIGEQRDADGSEAGAPFFNVSPPSAAGSGDFDGIYVDPASRLPIMDVAGGPGFCEVVDGYENDAERAELSALGLDHLVRFVLRGPAADASNPDTGLRIALHLANVEYLICGSEVAGGIVALDLRTSPPTPITDGSRLPPLAIDLIRVPTADR